MDVFENLTPHGFCLAWQPGLIWLQATSDALIACAYYSIPLALVVLVRRRRDLAFPWIFRLFATFILACGTTHVMAVITLWKPYYLLDGAIKALTAMVSIGAAILVWPLLPKALALPSPAALRASEERQRALYRGSPAALYALDPQWRVVDVSDHWLRLFGYERDEVIGRRIIELQEASVESRHAADWERLLQEGTLHEVERRFHAKDGSVHDVLVSATLLRDAHGNPCEVMAAVTDVTARKQAEAALRASEERLRQSQKMEAVGQLTGGIAHDFNNSLTAVMGSLELLRRRVPSEPNVARLLDGAMSASTRAARLTSQLLSFSRQQRLSPEVLDPVAVVDGMRDLLARTLGDRIPLHIDMPRTCRLACSADRNQLESALLNLALNARAAIHDTGEVRIAVVGRTLGDVAPTPSRADPSRADEPTTSGDYVGIVVSDSGCGMSEEVRRRAIEPFFTTKGVGEGTGLGLSQTYGFLRQSGGTLLIDSAPGRGSRIEMLLPRAAPALHGTVAAAGEAAEAALAGPAPQGSHRECVLVVDDEPGLADLAAAALRDQGFAAVSATSGDAALAALRQHADDIRLLFTDVLMPGPLSGVDLALEARRLRPDLPVIFATGHATRTLLAAWDEPATVLDKPYSMATLARQVAAMLSGAHCGLVEADRKEAEIGHRQVAGLAA